MFTTNLRKVGGSVMLAVPPALLDVLHLSAGSTVGLVIDHGCLVINPSTRKRYSVEELLAQCESSCEISEEDQQWVSESSVGNELI